MINLTNDRLTRKMLKKELQIRHLQWEVLDLRVIAKTVEPLKIFECIRVGIMHITFPINNVLFSNFGADPPLTKGIQFVYDKIPILDEPLINLFSLGHYDLPLQHLQDATATTKLNMVTTKFKFFEDMPDGLYMGDSSRRFEVLVQDDLSSSANTEIHLILKGWKF